MVLKGHITDQKGFKMYEKKAKTLSGNGGYPPPLNEKNPLSSF